MDDKQNKKIAILVPPVLEVDKVAKRINFNYSIVNTGSMLGRAPSIGSIEATLGKQRFFYTAMPNAEQKEIIESLDSVNGLAKSGSDKKRFGKNKSVLESYSPGKASGYLPYRLGTTPADLAVKPITVFGISKFAEDTKQQVSLESAEKKLRKFSSLKPSGYDRLTKQRFSNAIVSGARDNETGAVLVPTIRFLTEEGTINIKVTFDDGTFTQAQTTVRFAPEKVDIESEYVAGDGHVHTDYSWYMPTIHIANGPSIADRIKEGLDNGLRWMFFTDYSIQFFSQYSRGGIRHVGNAEIDPATGMPYRTAVWDDHVEECKIGLEDEPDAEPVEGNLLVVASQEVPSNIDSHNLVWASKNPLQDLWERPERVRSEQFDAPFFSIYHLLGFLFGNSYMSTAFSHDEPWQDRDMRMNPYEGYDKPPHAYFEHDLVWASGFLKKPFVVAAHPYNNSYKYKGLHLAMTKQGWKPMAVSHALGSSLVGFEIFEDPMNPARIAKHEVLAIWDMFLWHELPATLETGKFMVAFANSDAHLTSFSGQNKFGKTKTFLRIPDFNSVPEELLFEKVITTLEAGHCTCTSTGDFGTFVLKHKGKTYHPGDFVEIEKGDRLEFEIYGRPSSTDRVFAGGTVYPCVNPDLKAFDPDAVTPEKDTDYLEAVYQIMTAYAVESSSPSDGKSLCNIDPSSACYPGAAIGKTSIKLPFGTVSSALRAEVVFKNGDQDGDVGSIVYTNPIFVSFVDKP